MTETAPPVVERYFRATDAADPAGAGGVLHDRRCAWRTTARPSAAGTRSSPARRPAGSRTRPR